MLSENLKDPYEGKYFYEIVKPSAGRHAGTVMLFGPFDNIRYASGSYPDLDIKFVQIINGKIVAEFTEDQILVTDRKL